MKKLLLSFLAAMGLSIFAIAQTGCTSTNATGCICPPGGGTDCDLLPDIKASADALQGGYTVYTQTGNSASGSQGSNDGRLRLTGTTPNIGYGPLDTRAISKWLCGTDTLFSNPGILCPDGRVPKRFVTQRIYHKNGNVMSYTDVPCGTLTYHPSHGHMHVDNWGIYTLRLQNPAEPNPLNWSIVGTGTKLAFCLLDIGSCTGNPNYCRDDNNNPKTTTQIPNYGIGNGGYGCSSTLQGISNGYYDTYSQSLDGMWIDIPPGTCNGQYYVVVQIDPNQNMIELNENNNVIAVPVNITNQTAPGSPVMKISANKSGTILSGDDITLTATAGSSYLWSPGGGVTQSITVSNAGSYTCTVTNYCGTATSAPFVVSVLPAANAPVTTGDNICSGASASLNANNGGTGTIKWYDSQSAVLPLTSGTSYSTPALSNTTTYYVENEVTTTGTSVHVGPANNSIGSGAYQTSTPSTTWYEQFDAVSDLTLVSVKVYASTTGNRTFILQDRASTQLKSVVLNIPSTGANVINLNWFIPAGPGYKILVSGTPNLYYNTSGVSYPYSAPGVCVISGSYSGHSNYTFFYDFVVKSPDLISKSGRVPVIATVSTSISVNINASSSSICAGESATLDASGAATYSWSPGGATTSSIVVSPSGNTTYTVTGNSSGCIGSQSFTIEVNSLPVVSATDVSGCSGLPIALSGSPAGGNWNIPNPYSGSSTSFIYSYSDGNGCSNSASANVTSYPLPGVSIVPSDVSCFGGNDGSATASASGGTPGYSYSWNTNPIQTTSTASGLSGGNYIVTVTDANGCSTLQSQVIAEPANISSIASVTNTTCGVPNGAIDLSVSGGTGTYSYSWSPGGSSSQDLTGITGGIYSVLITDVNGCTNSNSFTVGSSGTAPASPTPVTGNAYVCKGSSGIMYSAAAVSGATSYTWTTPTGASISTGQGTTILTVNFSATQTSGNLCVYASNGCGNSAPVCKTLTVVTAKPGVPGAISGPGTACQGSSGIVYSCPPVANAATYNWTVPAGVSITSGALTNTITVDFAANFVKNSIKISASNCVGTSTQRSLLIYEKPATPGVITGPVNGACAGSTGISYSVVPVASATGYTWTLPANASIASGSGTNNITIDFAPAFTSGNLYVKADNVCGSSPARSSTIRSVPLSPGVVTGTVTACANQSGVAYSVASVTGATSYTWTAPTNASVVSGQGTNSVTIDYAGNFSAGNLTVKANNLCGAGPARTVTIKSIPSIPGTITGSATVCANQINVAYSVAAVSGATSYAWTVPAGANVVTGQGTNSVTVDMGTSGGTVSVRAENVCGQGVARTKTVTVNCRLISTVNQFSLFPNPTHDMISMTFYALSDNRYSAKITDVTGRNVYGIEGLATEGQNHSEINLSEFAKGVYTLTFEMNGEQLVKKVVVN